MRCQQKGDFFSNHRIVSVWLPPESCGVASQERRSEEQVVTRHNKLVSERIPKSLAIIAEVKKFEMSGRRVFEHEVVVDSHDTPPDAVNCVPYAETYHEEHTSHSSARVRFSLMYCRQIT